MVDVVFPIILLLVGLMFSLMSWGNRSYERQRRSRGTVLAGRIVGSEWEMNRMAAAFQVPVIEYVDQAGETVRFTHDSGTTFAPVVGQDVEVWLDPETGEGPLLHEDRATTGTFVLFGVIGVGTIGLAVFLLWSALA